jgi:ABC-type phosphate transport system permease subunit
MVLDEKTEKSDKIIRYFFLFFLFLIIITVLMYLLWFLFEKSIIGIRRWCFKQTVVYGKKNKLFYYDEYNDYYKQCLEKNGVNLQEMLDKFEL